MNKDIEGVRKKVKKHSVILAKLGKEISEIQFNYKVLDETNAEYWQKRIQSFKQYHEKGMEYYTQVHSLMNLVEEEEAGMFLLKMSKMSQLGAKLSGLLEKVSKNPSIMSSKDRQQSKWSKELREELVECSNKNLEHVVDMNKNFREFYEKHLEKITESERD